jgi:ribose transport system substrate-binding protein
MDATVAQSPFEMGRLGIESAVRVLHGENVDQEVRVPIELITKDRADVQQ